MYRSILDHYRHFCIIIIDIDIDIDSIDINIIGINDDIIIIDDSIDFIINIVIDTWVSFLTP